jgi:hypothetical protein
MRYTIARPEAIGCIYAVLVLDRRLIDTLQLHRVGQGRTNNPNYQRPQKKDYGYQKNKPNHSPRHQRPEKDP